METERVSSENLPKFEMTDQFSLLVHPTNSNQAGTHYMAITACQSKYISMYFNDRECFKGFLLKVEVTDSYNANPMSCTFPELDYEIEPTLEELRSITQEDFYLADIALYICKE